MRQNLRVSKQDTRCDHLTVGQEGQAHQILGSVTDL